MWLLYVSIKKYVQTYSLVWSFLTPVRRFEPTRFGRLFATPTLAHAQTFDRCVEHPQQTTVLTKTAGQLPGSGHCCLRASIPCTTPFTTCTIPQYTSITPQNFCITIVCNFSWDMKMSQEKSKTMPMRIFGG